MSVFAQRLDQVVAARSRGAATGTWASVWSRSEKTSHDAPVIKTTKMGLGIDTAWCGIRIRKRAHEPVLTRVIPGFGFVASVGTIVTPDGVVVANSPAAFDAFVSGCLDSPSDVPVAYAGSFQVYVGNCTEASLIVTGDHLMSRPLFTFAGESSVALSTYGFDALDLGAGLPRMSGEGALGFLTLGYPIAPNTLLEGVSRVAIGHCARVSATDTGASLQLQRIWSPTYGANRVRSMAEASEQLFHGLRRSVAGSLADTSDAFLLGLTGGLDSRLMLAIAVENGASPRAAFTWTTDPQAATGDAAIARRIADAFDVAHRVVVYDESRFLEHLETSASEVAAQTDNLGMIAAGDRILADWADSRPPVLVGDQLLGLGPLYRSFDEGIAHALGVPWPNLPAAVARVVAVDDTANASSRVQAQVEALMRGGTHTPATPKDASMQAALHVAVQGWLLAPGFYKEPAFEVRRPMLDSGVLQMVTRWSDSLRVDKRIMTHTLRKNYPAAGRIRVATSSAGLTDWRSVVRARPWMRAFLMDVDPHLLSSILGVRIEPMNRHAVDAALAPTSKTRTAMRAELAGHFVAMRRRLAGVAGADWLFRAIRSPSRSVSGPSELRVAFRLSLLQYYARAIREHVSILGEAR